MDYSGLLKRNKLRVTPQRLAILDYIMSTKAHPTAENIFGELIKAYPSLSLATVYKTLDTLRNEGVIQGFNLGEESKRYDGNIDPHAHFKCVSCKLIMDIDMPHALGDMCDEVSDTSGLDIISQEVFFYGHCSKCKPKALATK